jgi:hypothetical protein
MRCLGRHVTQRFAADVVHDPEGKRRTGSAPYDSSGEIGSKLLVYLRMPAQGAEPSCGITDEIVMDVRH